jgi:hypothetical protein
MRDVVTLYVLRASATEAQPLVYAVGHTYIPTIGLWAFNYVGRRNFFSP